MSCTFSCLAAASGVPIPLRLISFSLQPFTFANVVTMSFSRLYNHLPQTNTNVGEEIESNQDAT
ncbi:hypothetical protein NC651_039014 [Populus alba x Populus x berolinensis]|nr:hypothetical protein NC651_039014 [Populus alba x Populus x berolinensis]